MSLLDLPNELLLPIFTHLIGQFICALVFNKSVLTYHIWNPVTTLQLVCRPTRILILSICRQFAAFPADDPHQTVDPPRVLAPYRGLAFNEPATLPHLLADNSTPPLLRAHAAFTSALHVVAEACGSRATAMQIDEAVSSLITAEHLARQVNPRELSELVLDRIYQFSESMIWEKRFGKWINAMVQAKSQPNEITEEMQEEINDCLQALDNSIIPQRILQTSNLVSTAKNLAKHARNVQVIKRPLEYLDLSFTSPHGTINHTNEAVLRPISTQTPL